MRPTTQNRELACARQRSWSHVQAVEPMSPVVMRSARPIFVPPCPPLPPLWLRLTLRNERMRFPLPLATSTGGCMQGSVAHVFVRLSSRDAGLTEAWFCSRVFPPQHPHPAPAPRTRAAPALARTRTNGGQHQRSMHRAAAAPPQASAASSPSHKPARLRPALALASSRQPPPFFYYYKI